MSKKKLRRGPGIERLETRRLFAVVTTTADSGAGSLRQALLDANDVGGVDNITFNIPGAGVKLIQPLTPLPTIEEAVILDGTTQPGTGTTPLIRIDRPAGSSASDCFFISAPAPDGIIKGVSITGFNGNAIWIQGSGGWTIQRNHIGLDAAGTTAVANGTGIRIETTGNTIGGTRATGNVISGNLNGILITGPNAKNNIVAGNYIGTDVTGALDRGNIQNGISLASSAAVNTIGGIAANTGNVISGNDGIGVRMTGLGGLGINNLVQGNYIGTNAAGTGDLGNGQFGVQAAGLQTIGGTTAAERNIISGNDQGGLSISDRVTVRGNYIGTAANGTTALANSGMGIMVTGAAAPCVIGGSDANQGNLIANNTGPGIWVPSGTATILSNSIHSGGFGQLGIDLGNGGVLPNDRLDPDTGANSAQNFPVLVHAGSSGGSLSIAGYLDSTALSTFTVQFFANTTQHSTGHGEGKRLLGTTVANTDANGYANFSANFAGALANPEYVTATATDVLGETSEFSKSIIAGGMTINGDRDAANQDDTLRIVRNALDTSQLDIFFNNPTLLPTWTAPVANFAASIHFLGGGGDDLAIADYSNGLGPGITLTGGTQTTAVGDRFEVIGDGTMWAYWTPHNGLIVAPEGTLNGPTLVPLEVEDGLASLTITSMGRLTEFAAQSAADVVNVWGDASIADMNVLELTSGSNFSRTRFADIGTVLLNVGTGAPLNDAMTIHSPGLKPGAVDDFRFVGAGGSDTINVESGAYGFEVDAATLSQNLTVNVSGGATVTFNATQHLAGLSVNNASAALTAGGAKVLVTNAINMAAGGMLDLADNDMVVRNKLVNAVEPLVTTQIVSSLINGDLTTLGVAQAGDVLGLGGSDTALFSGETVSGGDVLIKYTYAGDGNLDGAINADDYASIDFYANVPSASGYAFGDFNHDGEINADDYALIDFNNNSQGAPL